jgi:epoxyqueuosine reductase
VNASELSAEIKRRGGALGFSAIGIAGLERNAHADELEQWLAAGYAGTMQYLHRQSDRRKEPARVLPGANVAIVTLTNYFHESEPHAHVAQYAWSSDYHEVLGNRLEQLAGLVRELVPESTTRCYVDAGPIPERELAQRAGLGWIGKNMMLINPEIGSFTFIGVVLTDARLAVDLPFAADRCGTCRRCLDACPTDAFIAPRTLDARRCISYLTIEHRGEFTPAERQMIGDWMFGCDVCQDVCPWNVSFARATDDPALTPCAALRGASPETFATLTPEQFHPLYDASPFERPGYAGMRRNALALLENQRR